MASNAPRGGLDSLDRKLSAGAMALALIGLTSLSACENNPPAEDGMDMGDGDGDDNMTNPDMGDGDGDTQEDPCAQEMMPPALTDITLSPGEGGSAVVTDPASPHVGASLTVPEGSPIFPEDARILLYDTLDQSVPQGYNLVGEKTPLDITAVYANQEMISDADGNCIPNLIPLSQADMAIPANQPVLSSPSGLYGTAFRVNQDGSFTQMESHLTENGAEVRLAELGTHVFLNSKPDVMATAEANLGEVTIDLTGTTDEGEAIQGLNLTVDGYEVSQDPQNPNRYIINGTVPAGMNELGLHVTGLNGVEGADVADTVFGYEMPLPPSIENMEIDCSSTFDLCLSGGIDYPVNSVRENATKCTGRVELISGAGPAGTLTPMDESGVEAPFNYNSGMYAGDIIRLIEDCEGPGGVASAFIDVDLD